MKTFCRWIGVTVIFFNVSVVLFFLSKTTVPTHEIILKAHLTNITHIMHFNLSLSKSDQSNYHQVCVHPELKPFDQHILKYIKKQEPIHCEGTDDWILVSRGLLILKIPPRYKLDPVECKITYIVRSGDFSILYSKPEFIDKDNETLLKKDHFRIICELNSTKIYDRIHTTVVPLRLKQVIKNKTNSRNKKYNVFVLGFDSISRMGFMRNLPKSYKYFTTTMSGQVMTGYNIVGDGTFRNIVPFVTGKSEKELPNTLKSNLLSKPMDVYPIIWKDFKKRGYVTNFAEDCAYIGTFSFRRTGFSEQPTHHYMRPFHLAVEQLDHGADEQYKEFCVGSRKKVDIFFEYVKDFWATYLPYPRFMYAFHSEQSHSDNINLASTLDLVLLDMLQNIHSKSEYSDTVFVLMSDHGSRFSGLRQTLQGKQEERLPFLGFVLPKSLQKEHPEFHTNLQINSNRLSSPSDVHATLLHVLSLASNHTYRAKDEKSLSLFQEIPLNRSCEEVGIDEHWCACLDWKPMDHISPDIRKASSHIIKYINSLLDDYQDICQIVSLHNVTQAMQLVPKTKLLRFKKSIDDDKLHESFQDNTPIHQIKYQIWLITHPGHARYEVTMAYTQANDSFSLSSENISRLDKYGHTADCITEDKMDLRKYCYCK